MKLADVLLDTVSPVKTMAWTLQMDVSPARMTWRLPPALMMRAIGLAAILFEAIRDVRVFSPNIIYG